MIEEKLDRIIQLLEKSVTGGSYYEPYSYWTLEEELTLKSLAENGEFLSPLELALRMKEVYPTFNRSSSAVSSRRSSICDPAKCFPPLADLDQPTKGKYSSNPPEDTNDSIYMDPPF